MAEHAEFMFKQRLHLASARQELENRLDEEVQHFMNQAVPVSDNPTIEVPSNYQQGMTKKQLRAKPQLDARAETLFGAKPTNSSLVSTTAAGLIVPTSAVTGKK